MLKIEVVKQETKKYEIEKYDIYLLDENNKVLKTNLGCWGAKSCAFWYGWIEELKTKVEILLKSIDENNKEFIEKWINDILTK